QFGENLAGIVLGVLVFLAATTLAFVVMAMVRVQGAVRRRAAGIHIDLDGSMPRNSSRSLRHSSLKAVQQLLEYTTKHYSTSNDENMKVLRRRMMQAGIYDSRAVAWFFIARTLLAVVLAFGGFFVAPMFIHLDGTMIWLAVGVGGVAGYV